MSRIYNPSDPDQVRRELAFLANHFGYEMSDTDQVNKTWRVRVRDWWSGSNRVDRPWIQALIRMRPAPQKQENE